MGYDMVEWINVRVWSGVRCEERVYDLMLNNPFQRRIYITFLHAVYEEIVFSFLDFNDDSFLYVKSLIPNNDYYSIILVKGL